MLTQCPSCQTIFRVTHEILRIADGQVRCGRCHTQFDALARLVHEEPALEVELSAESDGQLGSEPADSAAADAQEPEAREDITLEGNHIEISGMYRVLDADAPGGMLRQRTTEEWIEIEDIEDTAQDDAQDDAQSEPEAVPEEIELSGESLEQDEPDQTEAHRTGSAAAPQEAAEPESALEASTATAAPIAAFRRRHLAAQEEEDDLDLPPVRAARRPRSWLWTLLALPLLALLAMQITHHYRAELARHPRIGEWLGKAYGALDLPLTPQWDLHAYEIRQWGVAADPTSPGTLKVRATIANRAEFPQPYPLLKLILEDRWGDEVRARALEPAEYLDPAIAADRRLAPGQQANATVAIVDPGPDAEGFRFDVCLHGAAGPVCAADVPAR